MKRFLSLIGFVICGPVFAQSNLPPCQGSKVAEWTDCAGSVTLDNGDKYVGDFKNGKFHGAGVYTFAKGWVYVGGFRDGSRHGKGSFTSENGEYAGEY